MVSRDESADVTVKSEDRLCPHLIVPGFPAEHLGALEAGRQTLAGESSAFWEELHVDALAEVDEDQAVVQVLRLETLVLQEPEAGAQRRLTAVVSGSHTCVKRRGAVTSRPAGSCQA